MYITTGITIFTGIFTAHTIAITHITVATKVTTAGIIAITVGMGLTVKREDEIAGRSRWPGPLLLHPEINL